MLDLRRLRLLRELNERGTIAAVADALQFTPSAVSQQLAQLEREAGVPLLERQGRGVRLTDAALMLVEHAEALLERAELAEAELAAAAGTVAGRGRIAGFQSVLRHIALPAIDALARDAPRLRCELHRGRAGGGAAGARPRRRRPRDRRRVAAPAAPPAGGRWSATSCCSDPVYLVMPARHPAARRHSEAVPLAELAGEVWTAGHVGMGWEEMTYRTCRELGGFEPDIRHRANDATICVALVARGLAVAMLPELPLPERRTGLAIRRIAEGPVSRADLRRHPRRRRRAPVHAGAARGDAGRRGGAADGLGP